MADPRRQMIGRRSKESGEAFERWITAACKRYQEMGIACIAKTPEPMKPIKSLGQGRFVACFTKKGQPDYKGILCDGSGIMFEAKRTDSDRIFQNAVTDAQWKSLDVAEFAVQRYDAYSTNSVYLELDYGVCNSIRISDHPGKKYLKYRYNIGPFVNGFKEVKDKHPRFYYRVDKSARMIKRIIQDRDAKKFHYGESGYERLMRKNQSERAGARGFWSKAVLLD